MDWDELEVRLLVILTASGMSDERLGQFIMLRGLYRGDSYEKYWQDKLIEIREAAVTEFDKSRKRYLGEIDLSGIPNFIARAVNFTIRILSKVTGNGIMRRLNAESFRTGMLYFEWAKLAIDEGFVCKPTETQFLIFYAALTLHDLTERLNEEDFKLAWEVAARELTDYTLRIRLERENPKSITEKIRFYRENIRDAIKVYKRMGEELSKFGMPLPPAFKQDFDKLELIDEIAEGGFDQLEGNIEDWEELPQNRLDSIAEAIRTLQETRDKDFEFKYKYQWIGVYEVMCEHQFLPDNEKSTFCRICNSPNSPNYFLPEDEHKLPNAYVPGESWEKDSTWHQLSSHGSTPRQRKIIDKTKREFELLLEEHGVI